MKSTIPFLKRYFSRLPAWVIAILVLFALVTVFFAFLVNEVFQEQEYKTDQYIFDFLAASAISASLTSFMETITHFASGSFLKITYGLLVLSYLVRKDWKRAIEIAVIGLGGFLVNYYLKLSFERPRPSGPLIEPLQNFSFPSGHATSGFIFYGLLIYLIWKTRLHERIKWLTAVLLFLFAMLIGFSRVYLRLHYPSDVMAGFCIGFAWLVVIIAVLERLKKKTDVEVSHRSKDRD